MQHDESGSATSAKSVIACRFSVGGELHHAVPCPLDEDMDTCFAIRDIARTFAFAISKMED
jgi:hypothetical protein